MDVDLVEERVGKMRNVKEATRGTVASCYRPPERFVPVFLTGYLSVDDVRGEVSGATTGRQKSDWMPD